MIRRPPRSTLSSSSAASDVYKRRASVLTAREAHDLVAGQARVRSASILADPLARLPVAAVRLAQDDVAVVDGELDLSVRQQSVALADALRDGHLTFGGDPHGSLRR